MALTAKEIQDLIPTGTIGMSALYSYITQFRGTPQWDTIETVFGLSYDFYEHERNKRLNIENKLKTMMQIAYDLPAPHDKKCPVEPLP